LPVIAFIVSAAVGFFTIRWAHLHAQFTADRQEDGSHKIHSVMVPRVGGFGIFVGWMAGLVAAVAWSALPGPRALTWLAAVSVVFIAGLTEDLTKKVSPRDRLQATLISALLGAWLLGATLNRLDNGLLDLLFIYPPVAILVTAVAVGGVAHAVNVIDGLNGLAGSICLMALAALGWLWLWSMPAASLWLRVQVEQQNPARSIPALPNAPAIVVLGGGVSPPQPERPDPDLRAAADRIGRADGGGMTRFKGRGREMGCCAWRYKLRGPFEASVLAVNLSFFSVERTCSHADSHWREDGGQFVSRRIWRSPR
jgi:hypothetical protein